MREIKFRVWDKESQTMWLNAFDHPDYILEDMIVSERFIPLQYTGLKDKNGTEIYEGDVVRAPNGTREVSWNQLHCSWGLFRGGTQSENMLADWINEDGSTPKQWECKNIEVIGNIYENEELLTKK